MERLDIKGVNLGNWLVLEKWMSPAMFEDAAAVDEHWLAADLPADVYAERLRRHRNEYITERDFAAIAAMGLNSLRIPVPYFIFGDRPPFIGCIKELDNAFDLAEKYNLKILIDLHTVPGSQNGFDNGGLCGVCKWAETPEEVDFVLNLLEKLAVRYGNRPGLLGIQPLNEPVTSEFLRNRTWEESGITKVYVPRDPEMVTGSAPITHKFLREFYTEAYKRISKHMGKDKYFVFHDAFNVNAWDDFMPVSEYPNVVLDTHIYMQSIERFGYEANPAGYERYWNEQQAKLNEAKKHHRIICGEWCLSNAYTNNLTDCNEKDALYKHLGLRQLDIWSEIDGFFYWSYKLNTPETGLECWDLGFSTLKGWINLKK